MNSVPLSTIMCFGFRPCCFRPSNTRTTRSPGSEVSTSISSASQEIDRDWALAILQPALMQQGIYSRGRFGAWRYEIGNMDHSVLMGVAAANHIVRGEKELVFYSS